MKRETNFTAYDTVRRFEEAIARYAGSKYAVAVDSCCNALFLCCASRKVGTVTIPKFTYPGVACAIINAGGRVEFENRKWKGIYDLTPYGIIDSALRFQEGMYIKGTLYCLSFHLKKHLPIGRGGMILTDDKDAYEWLKKARFDGRDEVPLDQDNLTMTGWNMYMTPEQASRGLSLFELIKDKQLPDIDSTKQGYPDLSKINAYQTKKGFQW